MLTFNLAATFNMYETYDSQEPSAMDNPEDEKPRLKHIVFRLTVRIAHLIWHYLLHLIYGGPGEKIPPIDNLILLDSATVLAQKIRNKKLTSVEVVNAFIERINKTNKLLNGIADCRFEGALEDARKADDYVNNSGKTAAEISVEFPYLGVPFTCKDAIAVKGLKHTAGLYLRKDFVAEEDADIIKLLRQAGAIPLANSNIPELCFWWETCNSIYGRTSNPYNTNRTSGGSTGGDAANIAVGGSPMGFGSDIGGSIRIPAHFNGIFGHKPSSGIVSYRGHEPLPRDDSLKKYVLLGPLSRFASDLLPLMKVIATPTGRQLLNLDQKVDISKLKVFYSDDGVGLGVLNTPVKPEIKQAMITVLSFLKKTHGIQVTKVSFPAMKKAAELWMGKMGQPGENQIAEELANNKGKVNILLELIKLSFGLSRHTLVGLAAGLTQSLTPVYGSETHKALVSQCDQLRADFQSILGTNGVFICPTMPTPAMYHLEPLAHFPDFAFCGIFNVLTLPSTHCPLGLNSERLPIGLQVVAGQYQDRLTLAMAEELERAFGGWVPPCDTL